MPHQPSPSDSDASPPPRDHTTRLLLDASELSSAKQVSGKNAAVGGEGKPRSNKAAADKLLEVVYDDCRRLAASYLKRENAGHTLQPTALAHEVYMRLIEQERVDWKGRTHFMAIAAQAMRRLLIDHARGRDRQKRGGGWKRVAIDGGGGGGSSGTGSGGFDVADPKAVSPGDDGGEVDIEVLDRVLAELAELDDRQAKVVEMRYLAGMTVEEVAEALGVSKRTVEGDWTMARAWLRKRLSEEL